MNKEIKEKWEKRHKMMMDFSEIESDLSTFLSSPILWLIFICYKQKQMEDPREARCYTGVAVCVWKE